MCTLIYYNDANINIEYLFFFACFVFEFASRSVRVPKISSSFLLFLAIFSSLFNSYGLKPSLLSISSSELLQEYITNKYQ